MEASRGRSDDDDVDADDAVESNCGICVFDIGADTDKFWTGWAIGSLVKFSVVVEGLGVICESLQAFTFSLIDAEVDRVVGANPVTFSVVNEVVVLVVDWAIGEKAKYSI